MQKILTKGKDTTALLNKLAELVNILAPFPKMRCICINADTLCNAGAYIYQELGYALAWGNEYLNLMVEAGIPAALAAKKSNSTSASAVSISWKSRSSAPHA